MQSDDSQPRQNDESSHVEQTDGLYMYIAFIPVKTFTVF